NSTIAGNDYNFACGGIDDSGSGTATIGNSILANNSGNNCLGYSSIYDAGGNFNFDSGLPNGDPNCPSTFSHSDPGLSAGLADNGGLVQTIALLSDSNAINSGLAANCAQTQPSPSDISAGGPADQRFVFRPEVFNGT